MNDRIITTTIQGGLGNQLFIIFAALGAARKQSKRFLITKQDSTPPRPSYWNELLSLLPTVDKIEEKIEYEFKEQNHNVYQEISNFDKNFKISGYFQSSKYFNHISSEVRSLISLRKIDQILVDKKLKSLREKWLEKQLIFVHVRRGDYLQFSDYHLNLPLEYYRKSFKHFDEENTVFIFFSDDLEYCKENFKDLKYTDFVSDKDYKELIIMSKLDGGIMANSSFSWWAAWLGDPEKKKKIICPSRWFVSRGDEIEQKDRLEDHWIKIKT
jgi:hypothetical protein